MSSEPESFGTDVQSTDWASLRQHLAPGRLITVSQSLDLAAVAIHVAEDDKSKVAAWIESGQLSRPTPEQVKVWEASPDLVFCFVIVQPFVLIQPKMA